MDDCVFCKIVKGEISPYKIYEDDKYFAFLDLYPVNEGHCLVIPKKHYKFVWDVDNPGEYFATATKIANHLKKVTGVDAIYSYIYGETVPHAHIHLIPKEGDIFLDGIKAMGSKKLADLAPEELVEKLRLV